MLQQEQAHLLQLGRLPLLCLEAASSHSDMPHGQAGGARRESRGEAARAAQDVLPPKQDAGKG
jgi:hypothetical protein